MASTSQAATKRNRASTEQLSAMIDFFQETPELAGGKFHRLHGKLEHEKKWEEMASKLNAVGGAEKSIDQWRTELQLALEDGEEIVFQGEAVESEDQVKTEVRPETPKTPTMRTPRRALKRKREEEQSETEKKFLEVAQTQADAMKMLAESFPRLVEVPFQLAGELRVYGEGQKACADAINNLARALGPQ